MGMDLPLKMSRANFRPHDLYLWGYSCRTLAEAQVKQWAGGTQHGSHGGMADVGLAVATN